MASTHNLVALVMTILLALITTMASASNNTTDASAAVTLAARLKLEGEGSTNCWDSLFHLQSCTGEVIMFFLNGETYLGPTCCQAIRVVGHDCWPDMLASLGYTSEEGDVLQGYCDAKQSPPPPTSPTTTTTVVDNATTNVLP